MSIKSLASVEGSFSQRVLSATGLSLEEFNNKIFTKESSKIVQVSIHNNCPQSCSHCFQLESPSHRSFDSSKLSEIFHKFDSKVYRKYPFPREPLLIPELFPMYKEVGCAEISTTTLQLRKRPEIIHELKTNGISTVFVSLHGNKEQHSKLTRSAPKKYDDIIEGIKLLVSSKINVEVVTTLYKHNIDALDYLPKELVNLGVSGWWIQRIMPIGRASSWKLKDFIYGDECDQVIESFANLRLQYKPDELHIGLDLTWGPNFYSSKMIKYLCGQEQRWPWSRYVCPAVSGDSIVISYETENIYPCLFFETFPEAQIGQLGNLTTIGKFSEQGLINGLQGQCKECLYKTYCLGGCRSIAFSFAKYLQSPDPFLAGQDYCLTRAIDKEFGTKTV